MTVVLTPGCPVEVEGPGEHGLVFGICLLRPERPRKIQIAARPGRLCAQASKVVDDLANLILGQHIPERRHDRGKRPRRTPVGNDGTPLRVWFSRGGRTIAEIRKRRGRLEAREIPRLSLPTRPVARDTPGLINLLSGIERERARGGLLRGCSLRGQRDRRDQEQHERRKVFQRPPRCAQSGNPLASVNTDLSSIQPPAQKKTARTCDRPGRRKTIRRCSGT